MANEFKSREKYGDLLKDKDIVGWRHDVTTGSKVTGDVYFRRLGSFCNEVKKTPLELIKMKDKALNDLITDYIMEKEKEGYAGGYIKSTLKAVKSWLQFNGIKLQRNLRVKGAEDTPTLDNAKVPNQEELKKYSMRETAGKGPHVP